MRKGRSVVHAFYLVSQSLIVNLVSVPATAYIIRRLGPIGFGQWSVAVSLVAATGFLTNLGLRPLFVRDMARNPEVAATAFAEQLGLRFSLAACASLLALAVCLCLHYPPVVLVCVVIGGAASLASAVFSVAVDVLQAQHEFRRMAAGNMLAGLALTALSVLAVWLGAGPRGLALAYLAGPVIGAVWLGRIVHTSHFPVRVTWNVRRYAALLTEVKMLGVQQVFTSVQDRVEQLLIPRLAGMAPMGYFSAGIILPDRLKMFPDSLTATIYPKIASAWTGDDDGTEAIRHVRQLLVGSLIVCLPLAVLVTFLAGPIAELLFPRNAVICKDIIRITIWSVPLVGLAMPMGVSMQAVGRHSELGTRIMCASLCSMAVSVALVRYFHMPGACWSWVLRSAILVLWVAPGFLRIFPSVPSTLPTARIATCAGLMALAVWIAQCSRLPAIAAVLAGGGVALGLYLGGLICLGVIPAATAKDLLARLRTAASR